MDIDSRFFLFGWGTGITTKSNSSGMISLYPATLDPTINTNYQIALKDVSANNAVIEISKFTETSGTFHDTLRYNLNTSINSAMLIRVAGHFQEDSYIKLVSGTLPTYAGIELPVIGLPAENVLYKAISARLGDTYQRRFVFTVPKGYKVTPEDTITLGHLNKYHPNPDNPDFTNSPITINYDKEYPAGSSFMVNYYNNLGASALKFTLTKVDDSRDINTVFTGSNFEPRSNVNTKNPTVTYSATQGRTFSQPLVINYYSGDDLLTSDSIPATGTDSITVNYRFITDAVDKIEVVGDSYSPVKNSDFKHHYLVNQDTLNKMSDFITVKTVPNERDYSVYVSSLYDYDFIIDDDSTNSNIILSNVKSGYYAPELHSDIIKFDLGSISIPNSSVYKNDSVIDILLPYSQPYTISYDDLFSDGENPAVLTFKGVLNLNTGYMLYNVFLNSKPFKSINVMVANQIPFYSSQYSLNISNTNNSINNGVLAPTIKITYHNHTNELLYNHKDLVKGSNLNQNLTYSGNINSNVGLSDSDFTALNNFLSNGFIL